MFSPSHSGSPLPDQGLKYFAGVVPADGNRAANCCRPKGRLLVQATYTVGYTAGRGLGADPFDLSGVAQINSSSNDGPPRSGLRRPILWRSRWCKRTAAGGSSRDVQLLAGHRSLLTTQRYIDGDTDVQRQLVALI
jgi:hypothetical protein